MKINVIKIGGNIVENAELLEKFAKDFAALKGPKVLIHGGGVMASQMQKNLGMQPVMINGRRVTDAETLKIVTMVYAGWCNKSVVALLQKHGCSAVGLCGADANLIEASKRPLVKSIDENGNETMIDYGYVGDVDPEKINASFLSSLIAQDIVPVCCAITHDKNGNLLNTNADTIASSIAIALSAWCDNVELTYCFEKNGVLYDKDDDSSVIAKITPTEYDILKRNRIVADGMLPKLENSFAALRAGVSAVIIKHAGNINNSLGTTLTL